MKPSSLIRHVCRLLFVGFAGLQIAIAADTPTERLLADLKEGNYDILAAPVDAAYQRFLKSETGEDAILEALHPFSNLRIEDLRYLDTWVEAQPDSGIALLVHAYFLFEKGREMSGTQYTPPTTREPVDARSYLFDRAHKSYVAAVGKLERCNVCYGTMIRMMRMRGRHDEMRQLFDEAMAIDPLADKPVFAYYLGLPRKWGGTGDDQDEFIELFRQSHPANPAIKRMKADRLYDHAVNAENKGDKDRALRLYNEALAVHPAFYIYVGQAKLLRRLKRFEEAKEAFAGVVDTGRRPTSKWEYENRGWAHMHIGRFDEAKADLRKAIDLGSSWAFETLFSLYRGKTQSSYTVEKELEKAIELLDYGVQLRMPAAYRKKGTMFYFGEGDLVARDLKAAAVWFEHASDCGHADAKVDLGVMYWRGEGVKPDQTKAIALWREAVRLGESRGDTELRAFLTPAQYFLHVTVQGWLETVLMWPVKVLSALLMLVVRAVF